MPISLVISRGKNGGGGGSRDESRQGKIADIIRMEGKEFMTAIEKAESVEHFLKEATHTLAAVMMFCAEK